MDFSTSLWAGTILWLYCGFMVFWGVQWWLGRHIQGLALLIFGRPGPASSIYFWMLAPGVILHELSHWFAAKALLVPTKDLVLFRPQRPASEGGRGNGAGPVTLGYVEIFKTDPLRQSLIGLAPLPVGILTLLLLASLLNFGTGTPAPSSGQSAGIWQAIAALPGELLGSFRHPLNLLWLYLVFTVSNGMLPSRPDRKPWLIGFILPGTILLLLSLTGTLPPLPLDWQRSLYNLVISLTWIFAFAALINLLLASLIFLLEWLVSRFRRRRVVYK